MRGGVLGILKRFLAFFIVVSALYSAEISKSDMEDLIKKCELKDGESCHKIAYHYANGSSDSPRFFKADNAKKEAYLTKGCNGGFAQSCYILGLINYDNFYKKNGDKNEFKQKSKQFIQKACDLGFEKACGENWDLP